MSAKKLNPFAGVFIPPVAAAPGGAATTSTSLSGSVSSAAPLSTAGKQQQKPLSEHRPSGLDASAGSVGMASSSYSAAALPSSSVADDDGSTAASPPAVPTHHQQMLQLFHHTRTAFADAVEARRTTTTTGAAAAVLPAMAIDSVLFERFLLRSFMYAHGKDVLGVSCTTAAFGTSIPQIQPFWLRYPLAYWTLAAEVVAEVELQLVAPKPPASGVEQMDRDLLKGLYVQAVVQVPAPTRKALAAACVYSLEQQGGCVTRGAIDAFVTQTLGLLFLTLRGSVGPPVLGPLDAAGHAQYAAAMQSLGSLYDSLASLPCLLPYAGLALPVMLLARADLPQLRMHAETAAALPSVGKQLALKVKFNTCLPALILDFLALPPTAPMALVVAQLSQSEMFSDAMPSSSSSSSGGSFATLAAVPAASTLHALTINSWITAVFNILSSPDSHIPLVEGAEGGGQPLTLLERVTLSTARRRPPPPQLMQPTMHMGMARSHDDSATALTTSSSSNVHYLDPRLGLSAAAAVPADGAFHVGGAQPQFLRQSQQTTPLPFPGAVVAPQQASVRKPPQQQQQQQQPFVPPEAPPNDPFFTSTMEASTWFGDENVVQYALVSIATADAEPSLVWRILSAFRDAYVANPPSFDVLFSIMTEAAAAASAEEAAAAVAAGGDSTPSTADPAPATTGGIPSDLRSLLHVLSVSLRSGSASHARSIQQALQIAEMRLELLLTANSADVGASRAAAGGESASVVPSAGLGNATTSSAAKGNADSPSASVRSTRKIEGGDDDDDEAEILWPGSDRAAGSTTSFNGAAGASTGSIW